MTRQKIHVYKEDEHGAVVGLRVTSMHNDQANLSLTKRQARNLIKQIEEILEQCSEEEREKAEDLAQECYDQSHGEPNQFNE